MLSLLERNVSAIERRLVLVAPPDTQVPAFFRNVTAAPGERAALVRAMQKLRGQVYFDDGAVSADALSVDGRHQTPEDDRSWHLLMRSSTGEINACVWIMRHEQPKGIDDLRVRHCPLNSDPEMGGTFRRAVSQQIEAARRENLAFGEVGGWAVASHSRCTAEGLLLALAAYSFGLAVGGGIGLTTATVRHASSTILRRLGGSDLMAGAQAVPAYFDPNYGCRMELLRFDSRRPNPRYARLVELLRDRLADVAVLSELPSFQMAPARVAVAPRRVLHPQPVLAAC